MIFFSVNHVIKLCHTVSVLYRPNFQPPSNTAPNFYSPYVVTRYYSISTTEIKLLCASLIQFIYVPVSIQGEHKETRNQPDVNMSKMFF